MGHSNEHYLYQMRKHECEESVILTATESEKDLGVTVDCGLSFTTHIENQVSKANKIVGLIRRSFTFLDKESMKLLFVSLVRPLLEFANVAWSPKHQKDIDLIEQVQRRATRLVPSLKHLSYEQRLEEMKLPSLCFRRKRGDLIEVYKCQVHERFLLSE